MCVFTLIQSHTHVDTVQTVRLGPTMYWSPNFLAVVFKKQEISHQVVTRMQDLASEFSKTCLV